MRWKAHFHINCDNKKDRKETCGFEWKISPHQIKELERFEKDLADLKSR